MRGESIENFKTIRITTKQFERLCEIRGQLMQKTKKIVTIHEALQSLL